MLTNTNVLSADYENVIGTRKNTDVNANDAAEANATVLNNTDVKVLDNATGNVTNNVTNTTGNTTAQNLIHSTGNPIIALLAVSAALGCYAIFRREYVG